MPAEQVDPIYFDRTYFPRPCIGSGATPAVRAAAGSDARDRHAALGTFVLAGKEKLALIRVRDEALVLETLFIAEDVYSDAEIEEAVSETATKKPEVELAHQVIAGSRVVRADRARERLPPRSTRPPREEAKRRAACEAGAGAESYAGRDLMDALRQSVAEAKKRKAKTQPTRKRAATPKNAGAKKR